jgi:hypothetical protein
MARLTRVRRSTLLVIVALALVLTTVSACSNGSGLSLAREACGKVHQSIKDYDAAEHTSGLARAHDLKDATIELTAAEPLAAAATSADGQWNALMTTLNEVGQVDEGHLVSALRAQCAVANSSNPELPNTPTTFPPVPNGRGSGQSGTSPS